MWLKIVHFAGIRKIVAHPDRRMIEQQQKLCHNGDQKGITPPKNGSKSSNFLNIFIVFQVHEDFVSCIFSTAWIVICIFSTDQKIFKKQLYRLQQATVFKQTASYKKRCAFSKTKRTQWPKRPLLRWQNLQQRQQLKTRCVIFIFKTRTSISSLMSFFVTTLAINHLFQATAVVFEKLLQSSTLKKL